MGCCISTNKPPKQYPHSPNHHHLPESDIFHVGRAPPPLEEETVKEVLSSETPILKPSGIHHSSKVQEENEIEPMPMMIDTPVEVSEVSEVSEMYSMSGSFSTTVTEKRDDEAMSIYNGEAKHRVERSPAKVPRKRPYSGELAGGKERRVRSPAKRSEPSMEKRSHITSRGQVTAKRRNVGTNGIRRDSGESSSRRSRSPVTRTEGRSTRGVKDGSQTLNVTGSAGSRSPVVAEEKRCVVEKYTDGSLTAADESLENPLVSLECFIFL